MECDEVARIFLKFLLLTVVLCYSSGLFGMKPKYSQQ